MEINRDKQSVEIKKQEEFLASQKVPSKLARIIAAFSLIVAGTYISYILFFTENISARTETFLWVALLGLVIFYIKLLAIHASERGKFWKIFFSGTGFSSDKERRETNKNILILFILVVVGMFAVFFL